MSALLCANRSKTHVISPFIVRPLRPAELARLGLFRKIAAALADIGCLRLKVFKSCVRFAPNQKQLTLAGVPHPSYVGTNAAPRSVVQSSIVTFVAGESLWQPSLPALFSLAIVSGKHSAGTQSCLLNLQQSAVSVCSCSVVYMLSDTRDTGRLVDVVQI